MAEEGERAPDRRGRGGGRGEEVLADGARLGLVEGARESDSRLGWVAGGLACGAWEAWPPAWRVALIGWWLTTDPVPAVRGEGRGY